MIRLLFLLICLIPNVAFANGIDATLTSIYLLVKVVIVLLGAFLAFGGIVKIYNNVRDNRNPKNSIGAAFATLFAGSLLLNINSSITIIQNTFNSGSSGYCFYADSAKNPHSKQGCFKDSNIITDRYLSEVRGESEGSKSRQKAIETMRSVFSIAQLIGLAFFVKGLFKLKEVSEGNTNDKYGKVLIMLVSSALVMDLPHTLDTIIETIKQWRSSV